MNSKEFSENELQEARLIEEGIKVIKRLLPDTDTSKLDRIGGGWSGVVLTSESTNIVYKVHLSLKIFNNTPALDNSHIQKEIKIIEQMHPLSAALIDFKADINGVLLVLEKIDTKSVGKLPLVKRFQLANNLVQKLISMNILLPYDAEVGLNDSGQIKIIDLTQIEPLAGRYDELIHVLASKFSIPPKLLNIWRKLNTKQ